MFLNKKSPKQLVQFKWRKKSNVQKGNKNKLSPEVLKFKEYRNGGEGFIKWCEDNVCLAIYHEGSTVPKWTPMHSLPDIPNPTTGRSYKSMWEGQKKIVREALAMENGRFIYTLIVLCWQRGDGKCLKSLTKILMYDGTLKYAKDIVVGDLLMGDDNKPRTVLSLVSGKEEMFEVIPNRGESFTCTADHRISLKKRSCVRNRFLVGQRDGGNGEIIDIPLKDYINKSSHFKNTHQLYRIPVNWPHKDVIVDPYFLGIWLGDGNSNHPTITTMDKEVVDFITEFSEENLYCLTTKELKGKANSYSIVTPEGMPNTLKDDLDKIGVLNNKHIPQIYKSNSREIRLQLLAGVIDSDGSRNKGGFDLIFKSKILAEDIVFLARSLGFHAEMKTCKKTIKSINFTGEYYRIGISGDCSVIPVKVLHKKCSPRREGWKDALVTGIKEIRSVGEETYHGFMVDGNNRFVLGDFTVTNNSLLACLIQLWKFFNFAKQQIMLGANSKDQVKFVHYDIMKEIIINSPNLLKIIGLKNLQEKEMRLTNNKKQVISVIRSISSFSGIVSNITGYTFSEIFDMKNPKFFVQLDGSIRNIPNALGVIDSTVSEKTHILYKLYQSFLEDPNGSVYFSYRCSPKGIHEDFFNPQMTQKQLDNYKLKFPPQEFARYFKNLWDTGISKIFSEAQLEAMHYLGFKHVSPKDTLSLVRVVLALQAKNERIAEIEGQIKNNIKVSPKEIASAKSIVYDKLKPITDIYRLDYTPYMCEMATTAELGMLSEYYDTDWVIGIGIDRADPLKSSPEMFTKTEEDIQERQKKKTTTGARTMITCIAKGLAGSRSDAVTFLNPDTESKFIYVILAVKHCQTSTLEEIKSEISLMDSEYDGVDVICSERWGMFDFISWCEEKGIDLELISPTVEKQKSGFGELYLSVSSGRMKVAPIGYHGSNQQDILMEEMGMIESDPDKVWYGSPEKNKPNGVQDDSVYSTVWSIFGLRSKRFEDMRSRTNRKFLMEFLPNKHLEGRY